MRLIDADALPKYTGFALSADEVATAVENAPTVDAVPVVRCKDCQYSRPKESGIKLHCKWWYRSVEDAEYCSRGKRRKDKNV